MIFGIRKTNRFQLKLNETVIRICDKLKYLWEVFSERVMNSTIYLKICFTKCMIHVLVALLL